MRVLKNLVRKTIVVLSIFASFIFFLSSCQKEDEINLHDGIYFGRFNQQTMVAYEVKSESIEKLGYSFEPVSTIALDETSFVAQYPDDHNPRSAVCFLSTVTRDDYGAAIINTNKEFDGLHYAKNTSDITYGGGLIFAIKYLNEESATVTLVRLDSGVRYQATGTIRGKATPVSHRELTFPVGSTITNGKEETWSMTLNAATNYQWSNLFTVSQVNGSNLVFRFQVEVIDNKNL